MTIGEVHCIHFTGQSQSVYIQYILSNDITRTTVVGSMHNLTHTEELALMCHTIHYMDAIETGTT